MWLAGLVVTTIGDPITATTCGGSVDLFNK